MQNNRYLLLIFNHSFTPDQDEEARLTLGITNIFELPEILKKIWCAIPPCIPKIDNAIEPLKNWMIREARKNDYVLIQGDFGACYIMVNAAFDNGLIPIYSTTQRISSEEFSPDGSVKLVHNFKHIMFRRYER